MKKITSYAIKDNLAIDKYQFENGLTAIFWCDPSVETISFQMWYDVGSADEEKGKTGISHLFEHLMFKETRNIAEGEYDRLIEEHGGQNNASTWVDWTYYYVNLPKDSLELACQLEADRMANLILNEKQLNTERDVVINERQYRVDDNLDGKMWEMLFDNAYTVHPYKWDTIGYLEDIKSITLSDCLEFYSKYYSPNNALITLVGNFDTDNTLSLMDKYFGTLKPSVIQKKTYPTEPKQSEERNYTIEDTTPIAKILFGYHIPEAEHHDKYVLSLLNKMLFSGDSSIIHNELTIKQQLTSQVFGWISPFKDPGLYVISMDNRSGISSNISIDAIDFIIDRLDSIIDEKTLVKAKNKVLISYYSNMVDITGRASSLGLVETIQKNFTKIFTFPEVIRTIELDDVKSVVRKYLHKTNRTVIVANPVKPNGGK